MRVANGMTMFFGRGDIPSNWYIDAEPWFLNDIEFRWRDRHVEFISDIPCHCGELAFMLEKAAFFGDMAAFERILKIRDPKDIKAAGRDVVPWSQEKWDIHGGPIMQKVIHTRTLQVAPLRTWLLDTGTTEIVEASPYDKTWGVRLGENDPRIFDKTKWRGLNLLGKGYMTERFRWGGAGAPAADVRPSEQTLLF